MLLRTLRGLTRRVGMLWIRAELSLRRSLALLLRMLKAKPAQDTLPWPRPHVTFNVHPVLTSWGGGNQWLLQLSRHLASQGCSVEFSLSPKANIVFIAEPNPSNQNFTFGLDSITQAKEKNPHLRCIHRVNECDMRKGTRGVDDLLAHANKLSDYTVFVSGWLRDYHANIWFDAKSPHSVILNGADPQIFFPPKEPNDHSKMQPFRLVTHHWSDHWNKGFREYQLVDEAISRGTLRNCELWVIGRWPKEITWKTARTFAPRQGAALARLLRRCDLYLTASRWEPGAMHYVEGAQCGLPVLFHTDTGGAREVVSPFGIEFKDDPIVAVQSAMDAFTNLRARCLTEMPSGQKMCKAYTEVISRVLPTHMESHIAPSTKSSNGTLGALS